MKYVLTLFAGIILGGLLVVLFFTGTPRAKPIPGSPVKPPEQGGSQPGTALVVLDEKFFDTVLDPIFNGANAPSFPLKLAGLAGPGEQSTVTFRYAAFEGGCEDKITLIPEGSGIKSGIRLGSNAILAQLAFNGSYSILGNCVQFKGWAQASMQLSFDQEKQTVFGQLNVDGVNLDGAPPMVGGLITPLVQGTINQRVNPQEILSAPHLALSVPVKAINATLKARVKDVRSEVKDGALRLYITYDFQAERGQQPPV